MAPTLDPGAKDVLARMDLEEAAFAMRLRELMDAKGLTQAQLAERVGIGQPAISMMLASRQPPPMVPTARFSSRVSHGSGTSMRESAGAGVDPEAPMMVANNPF